MNDLIFAVGLGAVCLGAWLAAGWPALLIVVGAVVMAFGLLRQLGR